MLLQNKKLPIIVIGAGVSGLSCAQKLKNNGRDIVVLEAKSEIGGRLHSREQQQAVYDIGASWIHGIENNPIWDIVQKQHIETVVFNYVETEFFHENGIQFSESEKKEFLKYTNLIQTRLNHKEFKSTSLLDGVGAILKNVDKSSKHFKWHELEKILIAYFKRIANDPFATEYDQLCANFQHYEGYFEGDEVIFPKGYAQILEPLAQDLNIVTNCQIKSIECLNDAVRLMDQNNKVYEASQVVVSVPLGVLKNKDIHFIPALASDYLTAIQTIGFGSFNKVFVELEESLNLQIDSKANSFFFNKGDTWFNLLDLSKIYHKPVYLIIFGGELSAFIDRASDEEVRHYIEENAPLALKSKFENIKQLVITRWGADEFSHGSFSFPAVNHSPDLVKTLNQSIQNQIYFAGEHCSLNYAGTVHGAYLNGLEVAEVLLSGSD